MSSDRSDAGDGVATATAEVRNSIAELDQMIAAMRDEADQLLERAASRMALVQLTRQAAEAEQAQIEADRRAAEAEARAEAARVAQAEAKRAATAEAEAAEAHEAARGRHAADGPAEFDPTPYDPDEDDDLAEVHDLHAQPPAFGAAETFDVAAAPAFEPEAGDSASLPAFDAGHGARPFAADPVDHTVLSDRDAPSPVGASDQSEPGDEVADVIEFTPREAAEGPAFGALVPEFDPSKPPPPDLGPLGDDTEGFRAGGLPSDVEQAFGAGAAHAEPAVADVAERARRSDGLDAIAAESNELPSGWDGPAEDDDAFDKFFSADVEPEPAQRWLLNE